MDDKLKKLVAEVLAVPEESVTDSTGPRNQPKWDSLRHMNLVFAVEETYGVRFEDDDIARLTSVAAIEELLKQRG